MTKNIKSLPLWSVLETKCTDEQRASVAGLIDRAAALLDRVVETFPTYTLHNSTHAENLVRIMGELIGRRLEDLTSLEAAFLILAAYWHDVGMVFNETERSRLRDEAHWKDFLRVHPDAYIADREYSEPSVELAEWYCRWRHAERVYIHLDEVSDDQCRWGIVPIREELGELCISHNTGTDAIATNGKLQTHFLEKADLRFCALVLRLADILDFDKSRSPDVVYRYLDLARRDTARKKASDVEWRKHLAAEGFTFPGDRPKGFQLGFVAAPDHPAVEYDLRCFLDVIENEIQQCAGLLSVCSERWRSFALPGSINRENIKSKGYVYGEYRFSLEQTQVLELLMGDNLYDDPYTFVRELLQNAIDTSRLRQYLESANGNGGFQVDPIRVTQWRDEQGRQWVRVDDFGVGMDETIIRDHLLKVGSSYYKTEKFRADILRAQERGAADFTPISRFGIGLLSCFIVADRVEVSTLRETNDTILSRPVRLSLNGLHGFYTLQTPHIPSMPMPSIKGEEPGYRKHPGSSIAVRLDPRKEKGLFNLEAALDRHVFSSPVRIQFDGRMIGGDFRSVIERPWCQRTLIPLNSEEMRPIEQLLAYDFTEPLQIELAALDVTAATPSPELKGQGLVATAHPSREWIHLVEAVRRIGKVETTVLFKPRNQSFGVEVKIDTHEYNQQTLRDLSQEIGGAGFPEKTLTALRTLIERVRAARESRNEKRQKPSEFTRGYEHRTDTGEVFYKATASCIAVSRRVYEEIPLTAEVALRRFDTKEAGVISHNGISVPSEQVHGRHGTFRQFPFSAKNSFEAYPSHEATVWLAMALADSLRPDVDVSRESLRHVNAAIYTNGIVAIAEAARATGFPCSGDGYVARFTTLIGKHRPSLAEFLDKDLFKSDQAWKQLPLFETEAGTKSLEEIMQSINSSGNVKLKYYPGGWDIDERGGAGSGHYRYSFSRICANALTQIKLNFSVRLRGKAAGGFYALPGNPPLIQEGHKYFPPLTFVPYGDVTSPFYVEHCGANLNHPFSHWLIAATPTLAGKYPGIFKQIQTQLVGLNFPETISDDDFGRLSAKECRTAVNDALERLSSLDLDLKPPRSLRLKTEDFWDYTGKISR